MIKLSSIDYPVNGSDKVTFQPFTSFEIQGYH